MTAVKSAFLTSPSQKTRTHKLDAQITVAHLLSSKMLLFLAYATLLLAGNLNAEQEVFKLNLKRTYYSYKLLI